MSGIGIRCRHKRAKHNSGTHSKDQGFAHISLLLFPPSKLPSLVGKTRKRERLICCQSVSQHGRQMRQAACLPCNTLGIRSDAAIGSRTTVLFLGLPSHANGIPTRSPPQNLGGLSPDSCRGRSMASTEATGPGRVKTRSDLVVMPCAARIFAFFRSPCAHTPQKSWCVFTAQSFHTAWARTGSQRTPKYEPEPRR
jgi:hypothetical protein